jgi:putative hydrolase of the HAD superfamily
MFEAVIKKAGVNADQCIHVGDHLTDDIEGANNAGMHTIWVNMTKYTSADNDSKANIEVTSLTALPKALEAYQLSL